MASPSPLVAPVTTMRRPTSSVPPVVIAPPFASGCHNGPLQAIGSLYSVRQERRSSPLATAAGQARPTPPTWSGTGRALRGHMTVTSTRAAPGDAVASDSPHEPASNGDFQIVPLSALPVVAAVLVLLVVAVAGNWLWALDFFHVAGGALWTGIDLFLGFVIGPIMGRLPIPARVELSKRLMPKMVIIMPTLVICTLAAGWQLARHLGNLSAAYPEHGWVVTSFVVVAVMAIVAIGVLEPANLAVLFELKNPRPNGELIGRLMRRFIYAAGITGAMQIATLVIMSRLAT